MQNLKKELVKIFVVYVKTKKITQEQLSAKLQVNGCDITRSALAKIEVGQRHLYVDELKLIIEILNSTFEEIVN